MSQDRWVPKRAFFFSKEKRAKWREGFVNVGLEREEGGGLQDVRYVNKLINEKKREKVIAVCTCIV